MYFVRERKYYKQQPLGACKVQQPLKESTSLFLQCLFHFFPILSYSIANYPLGLGLNKVIIVLTDDSQPSPEVVSSYKVTIYREDRPSLPLFDDYMMCGFVQVLFLHSFTIHINRNSWFLFIPWYKLGYMSQSSCRASFC